MLNYCFCSSYFKRNLCFLDPLKNEEKDGYQNLKFVDNVTRDVLEELKKEQENKAQVCIIYLRIIFYISFIHIRIIFYIFFNVNKCIFFMYKYFIVQ